MRKVWKEDEYIVLATIYSCSKFSSGDDNNPLCKEIAAAFERNPGTIDRQWRNIKDILNEKNVRKIGSRLVFWTNQVILDPEKFRHAALLICKRNQWHLEKYLEDEHGT